MMNTCIFQVFAAASIARAIRPWLGAGALACWAVASASLVAQEAQTLTLDQVHEKTFASLNEAIKLKKIVPNQVRATFSLKPKPVEFLHGYVSHSRPDRGSRILEVVDGPVTKNITMTADMAGTHFFISQDATENMLKKGGEVEWIWRIPEPGEGWFRGEVAAFARYEKATAEKNWEDVISTATHYLKISEAIHDPNDLLQLKVLDDRAEAYLQLGRLDLALADGKRVFTIADVVGNANLKDRAIDVEGHVLLQQDRPEDALKCFQQVLDRRPDDPIRMYNVAMAYFSMDRHDLSILLCTRALKIHQSTGEQNSLHYANMANLLGMNYKAVGDYHSAADFLVRAIQVHRKHSSTSLAYGHVLDHMARLLSTLNGERQAIETATAEAIQIFRSHGSDRDEAIAWGTLVDYYQKIDQKGPAMVCLGKRLDLWKKINADRTNFINDLVTLAEVQGSIGAFDDAAKSLQIGRSFFAGLDHLQRRVAGSESILDNAELWLAMDRKEVSTLPDHLHVVLRRKLNEFCTVQTYLPGDMRLNWALHNDLRGVAATLGHPELSLITSGSFKGLVEESLAHDLRLARKLGGESAGKLAQLHSLRRTMQKLSMEGNSEAALAEIRREIDTLQMEENRTSNADRFSQNLVDSKMLASSLGQHDLFCDFYLFGCYKGKRQWEPHYGVSVLKQDGAVGFYDLGKSGPIEECVDRLRALMQASDGDEQEFHRTSRELYDLLIRPLEPDLAGRSRLIISPDGGLNFVSFTTLLDSQRQFLGASHSICYVSCARDLLREKSRQDPPLARRALLIGRPQFAWQAQGMSARTQATASAANTLPPPLPAFSGQLKSISGVIWKDLRNTENEITEIAHVLEPAGWEVKSLKFEQATEPALFDAAPEARIIHLATHGFAFEKFERQENGKVSFQMRGSTGGLSEAVLHNPMLSSGLCLAGADTTFRLWAAGQVTNPENDGVLLASEALSLDLRKARLVVASACDTGGGRALPGQGILGLRRSFAVAGAENLILALWKIPDAETAETMKALYTHLAAEALPSEALGKVQQAALNGAPVNGLWRQAKNCGAFVCYSFSLRASETR